MNENDDRKAWLASLKPGDKVARRYGWDQECQPMIVVRRTATQIVCAWEGEEREAERFRAEDAMRIGASRGYGRSFIEPMTEEIATAIQASRDRSRLRFEKWERLPAATLRQVCALLDSLPPASED